MHVVNLSLSTANEDYAETFWDLVDQATFTRVMVVSAMNNERKRTIPSEFAGVFSVACAPGSRPGADLCNPAGPAEWGARRHRRRGGVERRRCDRRRAATASPRPWSPGTSRASWPPTPGSPRGRPERCWPRWPPMRRARGRRWRPGQRRCAGADRTAAGSARELTIGRADEGRPDVGSGRVDGAFEGVGVTSGDQDHVAVVPPPSVQLGRRSRPTAEATGRSCSG